MYFFNSTKERPLKHQMKEHICKLGHSTPNDAKFLRHGNDPSQNLVKICQVVTIYKI